MRTESFDRWTRDLGRAATRRRLLGAAAGAAGVAVLAGARRGMPVAAQDGAAGATPVPAFPGPDVDSARCRDFILSGGPLPTDPIQVDDDLSVLLNDAPIFDDADGTASVMPPIPFQAKQGDQLTVVARDMVGPCRKIGPLWLHCAGGAVPRFLNGGQDDGCDEERRVPDNFYRESWRI